jgi:hypothetical protein
MIFTWFYKNCLPPLNQDMNRDGIKIIVNV